MDASPIGSHDRHQRTGEAGEGACHDAIMNARHRFPTTPCKELAHLSIPSHPNSPQIEERSIVATRWHFCGLFSHVTHQLQAAFAAMFPKNRRSYHTHDLPAHPQAATPATRVASTGCQRPFTVRSSTFSSRLFFRSMSYRLSLYTWWPRAN